MIVLAWDVERVEVKRCRVPSRGWTVAVERKVKFRFARAMTAVCAGSVLLQFSGCLFPISSRFLAEETETVFRDTIFFVLDTFFVEALR